MRRFLIFLGLLLTTILTTSSAAVQAQTNDPFRSSTACSEFKIDDSEFTCSYIKVPEQHGVPDGKQIELAVAVYTPPNGIVNGTPIFIAQGGPGGSTIDTYNWMASNISLAAGGREVVLFDQRGTLYSKPNLLCSEMFEIEATLAEMDDAEAAEAVANNAFKACYQRFKDEGVNLSAFNSIENAADVDALRIALGYERILFYGVSYGTQLGLHLMRDFPENLDAVILDGVVPLHVNFIPQISRNTEREYQAIFAACTDNQFCRENYPDIETRYFNLIDQLNENPTTIQVKDPATGKKVDYYLDGDGVMDLAFLAFYIDQPYATFPILVNEFEKGNFAFLSDFVIPLIVFDRTMSYGMYYSVICAEDADFDPADLDISGLRPQIAENAPDELASYTEACAIWQVAELPKSSDDPVTSDLPTLLLSGAFDPITPPAFAEAAHEHLPNSYHFIHPTGSHGVAWDSGCVDSIIGAFLDNPNQEPDGGCLEDEADYEFVPPDAFFIPDWLNPLFNDETDVEIPLAIMVVGMLGLLTSLIIWPVNGLINWLMSGRPMGKQSRGCLSAFLILLAPITAVTCSGLTAFALFMGAIGINEAVGYLTDPGVSGGAIFLYLLLGSMLLLGLGTAAWIWWKTAWPDERKWRLIGQIVAVLAAFFSISFLLAFSFYVLRVIGAPMINILAMPVSARALFLLPFLVVNFVIDMILLTGLIWQRGYWSIPQRLYFTGLTICGVLVAGAMGWMGMFGIFF